MSSSLHDEDRGTTFMSKCIKYQTQWISKQSSTGVRLFLKSIYEAHVCFVHSTVLSTERDREVIQGRVSPLQERASRCEQKTNTQQAISIYNNVVKAPKCTWQIHVANSMPLVFRHQKNVRWAGLRGAGSAVGVVENGKAGELQPLVAIWEWGTMMPPLLIFQGSILISVPISNGGINANQWTWTGQGVSPKMDSQFLKDSWGNKWS